MVSQPESYQSSGAEIPVRRVPYERPWLWLARGYRDFIRAPRTSIAYGLAITALSIGFIALLGRLDRLPLLPPLLAGFALVSPFLAVGLYGVSRTLERGDTVRFRTIVDAYADQTGQIALMGGLLMLIHIAWVRVATLLFALFFAEYPVGLPDLLDLLLRTQAGFAFLAFGSVVGAALAFGTFALSAISVPMLLDRDIGIVEALATSLLAVRRNPIPMSLWAALIAVAVFLGLITFFAGLIFTMPLVGYATWHAYRDLTATSSYDAAFSLKLTVVETNDVRP